MLQTKQTLGTTQQQAQYLLLVWLRTLHTLFMFGQKTRMVLDRSLLELMPQL
jgi:hypothetical protein